MHVDGIFGRLGKVKNNNITFETYSLCYWLVGSAY